MAAAAIVQKNHPTIYERDLHHCVCCSPPTKTLVRPAPLFGLGCDTDMPEFYCPKTHIGFRYSSGADTYIAGRSRVRCRDGVDRIA